MSRFNELEIMAKENGGVLITGAVIAAGISKPTLADYIKKLQVYRKLWMKPNTADSVLLWRHIWMAP